MVLKRFAWVPVVVGVRVAEAQPAPEVDVPPAVDVEVVMTTGRVVDVLGKPVRGAVVMVEGTETKTRTDRDGWFRIRAPIGSSLVVESAMGIGLSTVRGEAIDEIVLLSEAQRSETIAVTGEAPAAAAGAARLDRGEIQRVPGTGGDVVRALTAMPSVVNTQLPAGFTGIAMRGASPQDSRILVDDFEVPLLYHDIGFRTIIPAEAIASLELVPGGFDVAYGRATSGIVRLTTRPGDAKRSTQAELSVIDGGLLAQGPAGDSTRYMFALRRSTIDFVLPSVIPDDADLSLTTVPRYWDGQLRVDHELNKRWRLTLSGFGADDAFAVVTSKNEDAAKKRIVSRTRFARLTAAARYANGPWSATVALSALINDLQFGVGLEQRIDVKSPSVTPRVEVTRTAEKALGLRNVEWRFGGEAQVTRWDVDFAFSDGLYEGEPNRVLDPEDTSTRFDGVVYTPDYAAWTAVSADLDPKIRFTGGVRAEAFARPGELAVQPRGELAVKLAPAWKLRLAGGAYRRPPEYQTELFSNTVRSERARQAIAGVQWEPREGTRVQTSTYFTDRSALIRRDEMGVLTNTGRGRSYGAELLATHRASSWFGWLSYAYSHSTRVDAPGEEERLFDFDQPHNLNAAASWRRGRWQLGGRFQLYSGLPFTPVLGGVLDNDRNVYMPINAEVNSARAPLHHQLDLRVDYRWAWGPIQATAFLDVQNVYMQESVVNYIYSYDYTQRTAFKAIPLIPSLGVRGVL